MTTRPFNTAVYALRCFQLGLHLSDLVCMSAGAVVDMLVESGNDSQKYDYIATQEDFDRF